MDIADGGDSKVRRRSVGHGPAFRYSNTGPPEPQQSRTVGSTSALAPRVGAIPALIESLGPLRLNLFQLVLLFWREQRHNLCP